MCPRAAVAAHVCEHGTTRFEKHQTAYAPQGDPKSMITRQTVAQQYSGSVATLFDRHNMNVSVRLVAGGGGHVFHPSFARQSLWSFT